MSKTVTSDKWRVMSAGLGLARHQSLVTSHSPTL